jgi:putative transposase
MFRRWPPHAAHFRERKCTPAFRSRFGPIRQHFALKRHLLRTSRYRKQLAARFLARRELTELTQNPSGAFRAMGTVATSSGRPRQV